MGQSYTCSAGHLNLALTELAWKRHNRSYEGNEVNLGMFDSSALNFLVGMRMTL